ncbi:MAG: bifunctional diaminohydroxyphosphoribosylaminopyrimidine deaminase/5-amino-6-(5-phosphoribosylamino)uracil reductase RibD [Gammaproteobacteria bacterium]
MSFSAADHEYMARAIRLAARGLFTTDPNPRVGCVLVKDGQIIGEGWHARAGEAHAEVHALRQAGERAQGATAYVSLEPCSHHGRTPPCSEALLAAQLARVVLAMSDPNPQVAGKGIRQLQEAGIQVETGLLESEARALNPGFIRRMQFRRPYLRNKLAMSLDGRTAMANGDSKWITGEAARQDVQRLRARSSAILTGVGTILADDPALTVRLPDAERQPVRVIVDTHLSTPTTAKVLSQPGQTLILTANADQDVQDSLRAAGAEVIETGHDEQGLDLRVVLETLAELNMNEVLLETGATLSGAMLEARLIDEMVIYAAPLLMGDTARGLYHLPHLQDMADRVELDIREVRTVGRDLRITAIPIYK